MKTKEVIIAIVTVAIVVCGVVSTSIDVDDYDTYAGWQVVRAAIDHHKQIKALKEWDLDVWSRDSVLSIGLNDIRVNQTHMEQMKQMGIEYEIMIDDLEGLIRSERSVDHIVDADNWFQSYHTYPEIVARLQYYSSNYPSLVQYNESIGKTIQANSIPAVILSGSSSKNNKVKIFWSCQQHAREWIASHTCMYIIDQLVTRYATDSSIKQLLDNSIIHVIPLVNPDGYLYTWSKSRLWRKNRRLNNGGTYGVDLNRNWKDHWGGEGSSGTPSSDTYRGTKAFSEPETVAVSNYVLLNGPFDGGIDWHCYSQLILRPYGWTDKEPSNEKESKHVADTMRDRIYSVNRVTYTSEASWELYYTTGSAQDWYYSEGGIPLSYTFELRDTGRYGFVLPASEIIPCGNENFAAAKYFVDYIISNA